MILGFTGTQAGLESAQRETLVQTLIKLEPLVSEFHHGDCVGADARFHHLALEHLPNAAAIIHPPTKEWKRAFCKPVLYGHIEPPLPYLDRNKVIANTVDTLIVCPKGFSEITRSGTWSTYRYAMHAKKFIIIIFPDGTVNQVSHHDYQPSLP